VTAVLRPYQPADLPGVYRVCALADATGLGPATYRDPGLPGHVYAAPYAVSDPGLAFVVTNADGVAGYVVGTADAAAFARWADEHWWPDLRTRYPLRADPRDGTRDHVYVAALHAQRCAAPPWLGTHPAEAHLKLLEPLRGKGWGRHLMGALCDRLRERGVPGVHVTVAAANDRATAFYRALGFTPVAGHGWGSTLALGLR
jgi:ribosomal protein S18 acetylase RimI-like enzyme